MKCLRVILAISMAAALTMTLYGCGSKSSNENESLPTVSGESNSAANEENGEAESETDLTSAADGETAVSEAVNEDFDEEKIESVSEEERTNEESVCHEKLVEIISNSGANGYTVGRIGNSDGSFLMLSFGDVEASRYYDVYRIDADDVVLVQSMLVGSHTVVYIDEDTGNLAIYQAHMGHYGYGDLMYSGDGVSINWIEDNGVIGDDEDYPPIAGEVVTFTSIDDFDMIMYF